ncbi:hypothetical protein SGL43_07422 [Streptomyces globisporus]|uniref:Uncharacterized protein n=1 Tax=Streptomyces globisporus TaxID=1908 RepID=A0ABM9H9K0_STRGL|nr:SpdD protein [Streptomyces globisporus]CAH9420364.1 hypothetical protein SGL43_07422 [Streptomyces globisporus]
MTTTTPTAPAPTTAPAPVPPAPPQVPPTSSLTPPAPASRRSVLLLAATVSLLATAGLLYVLADRPDLREPLEATATIIGSLTTAAGVLWTISRALRHR